MWEVGRDGRGGRGVVGGGLRGAKSLEQERYIEGRRIVGGTKGGSKGRPLSEGSVGLRERLVELRSDG
jgi:hypothetical protein